MYRGYKYSSLCLGTARKRNHDLSGRLVSEDSPNQWSRKMFGGGGGGGGGSNQWHTCIIYVCTIMCIIIYACFNVCILYIKHNRI